MTADEIFSRLADIVNRGDGDSSLPEKIDTPLELLEKHFDVWLWWLATGRRYLPSQILQEPAEPFAVILELDSYYQRVLAQETEKKKDKTESG